MLLAQTVMTAEQVAVQFAAVDGKLGVLLRIMVFLVIAFFVYLIVQTVTIGWSAATKKVREGKQWLEGIGKSRDVELKEDSTVTLIPDRRASPTNTLGISTNTLLGPLAKQSTTNMVLDTVCADGKRYKVNYSIQEVQN